MKKLDKGFGKLSPDNMRSASQIPYLFASPHKVLQKIKDIRAGTYQEPEHPEKTQERMNMGNVLEGVINSLTEQVLELDIVYPVTEVMSKELGKDSKGKPFDLYASLDAIVYFSEPTMVAPIDGKIYTPQDELLENMTGKMVVEYKNMQGRPYDSVDELRLTPYGRGYLQAECQAWIADADYLCVAILFNGNDHRCYVMPTAQAVQADIVQQAMTFYQHLDQDTMYAPVDLATMAEKYNKVAGTEPVQLDEKLIGQVQHYQRLKEQVQVTEQEMERIQMKLVAALQDNEVGQINSIQGMVQLERKMRNYKAQPEKVVPAKEARSIRAKTVTIKDLF